MGVIIKAWYEHASAEEDEDDDADEDPYSMREAHGALLEAACLLFVLAD